MSTVEVSTRAKFRSVCFRCCIPRQFCTDNDEHFNGLTHNSERQYLSATLSAIQAKGLSFLCSTQSLRRFLQMLIFDFEKNPVNGHL